MYAIKDGKYRCKKTKRKIKKKKLAVEYFAINIGYDNLGGYTKTVATGGPGFNVAICILISTG